MASGATGPVGTCSVPVPATFQACGGVIPWAASAATFGATGPTGPWASGPPQDRRSEIEYELCLADIGRAENDDVPILIEAALSVLVTKNIISTFKTDKGIDPEARDPYLLIIRYQRSSWLPWQTAIFDIDNLTKDMATVIEVMDS
jgi:hypothetical protein